MITDVGSSLLFGKRRKINILIINKVIRGLKHEWPNTDNITVTKIFL